MADGDVRLSNALHSGGGFWGYGTHIHRQNGRPCARGFCLIPHNCHTPCVWSVGMRTAGDKTGNHPALLDVDRFAARIRQVRLWALAHGEIAAPDALRVICEVKAARRGPFDRWTLVDVDELVWHELVGWCGHEEIPVPAFMTETLWTYLGFIWATGVADPSSQTVGTLRASLIAYGGLGANGRPRPLPPPHPRRTPSRPRPQPREERPGGLAPIIPLRPRRRRPAGRRLVPSTPS